jgi:single-stranded DNA-specific DHH superfamily exonuclease
MQFQKAVEFLKSCKGKTAIICHGDADGCCSAAITAITLNYLHKKTPETFSPTRGGSRLTQDLVEIIKDFDHIIILDLGEKNVELISQIEHKPVLWLDHHKDVKPLETKILYINPYYWMAEEKVAPTSYLTYQIANMIYNAEELCWISAIGVIGDKEEELCRDVIDKTFELYPNLEAGSVGELGILKYIVGWISSGRSHSGGEGANVSTKALIEAGLKKEPTLIFEGNEYAEKLNKFVEVTKRKIREIFEQSKMEILDKAVICKLDLKSYIQNYLAGILRGKYPRKVIIVANFGLHEDVVQIELRRTSEIDISLRELSRESVKGLDASAGGHPEAAGVRIPKKDWDKFKKNILTLIDKH